MTLPANWKLVRVYGTYLRTDGLPNVGSVWFDSTSPVIVTGDLGEPALVVPRRIECQLDDTGTFSVALPATDDPDINPVGWTYRVREQMAGGREFSIDVPVAMDEIDLITWAQATPVPAVPPTQSYLTTLDIGVNVASQTDMDAAVAQAGQAAVDAAAAVSTANAASDTATAAQDTANAIAGTAQDALDTATAAAGVADGAATDAAAALSTANGIAGTANTALAQSAAAVTTANGIAATANTALTNANAAVVTANAAGVAAGNAQTTANGAVATANGIAGTANAALTAANAAVGVANTASADAASAITNANGRQPHDATLDALAALVTAANQLAYSTGVDAFAMTALTAFGRSLIDDADAATARNTLGLGGSAILPVGTGAATVAAGDDGRITRGGVKNKLINGGFDFWQRGTDRTGTVPALLADRWINEIAGTSVRTQQMAFAVGQTDVPGNPMYYNRCTVTSVANAANYADFHQRIENVYTLAGQTATLSFWAKADAAKNIAVEFVQTFGGTGGSPSVTGIGVTTLALTTAWKRYTVTVAMPSIAGKIMGSVTTGYMGPVFWMDAGSNLNARTGSLGQQSGVFDFSNIQFEPGAVATDFEQRPLSLELQMCQRYYQKSFALATTPVIGLSSLQVTGICYSTNVVRVSRFFITRMRGTPAVQYYGDVAGGALGQAAAYNHSTSVWQFAAPVNIAQLEDGFQVDIPVTATQGVSYMTRFNWTADAEL